VKTRVLTGLGLLGVLLVPLVGREGYVTHLGITMLVFSILASSLNLLMGYTGLVSIAHAAFFGIGAYTSGILAARYGVSFWLALPAAAAVAGLIALAVGVPSFRTRGIYYIIVTVAFQLIATEMFENLRVTGGGLGLKGIPRPGPLFQSKVSYYYLTLAIALAAHWVVVRIIRSPMGMTLMAIRDNETKARMMGADPLQYKIFVFVLASVLAGLAGSVYVHYVEYAHPDFFNFFVSVDLFLTVMLGGAGTVYGPVFGVVVLEVIREVLHEFAALRLLLFGLLLIVIIVFVPEGLLAPAIRLFKRLGVRPGAALAGPSGR